MLALLTALSFSFADFAVAFADEALIPEQATETEEIAITEEQQMYEEIAEEELCLLAADAEPVQDESLPQEENLPQKEDPQPLRAPVDTINAEWILDGINAVNVRELAKRDPDTYSTMQGSCCDGKKYVYCTFMNKSNDHIKVVKFRLQNGQLSYVQASGVIKFQRDGKTVYNYHGNDMAYIPNVDGKDKILITSNESKFTNHLTVFDVASMKAEGDIGPHYWDTIKKKGKHGFAGIAYDAKTHRLAAALKTVHDIVTFNLSVDSGEIVLTPIEYIEQARKETVFQGVDCDADFIYMVWSDNGTNRLYTYDWSGAKLKEYKESAYEVESIFHMGEGDNAEFYTSYYHSQLITKTITTTKKVKWKKVWNKKHTKKVWKYKKKKVKTKVKYIYRDAYMKTLGNLTTA